MSGAARPSELCIYCRTAKADTRDHVPPDLLFPSPKPNNLITVPACKPCNQGFQKDDEVLALVLSSLMGTNTAGRSVWETKVADGLLKRSPKLRRAIGSTLHYQPYPFRDGRKGNAPAVLIERSRLLRVLRRIVRGLAWHETGGCDLADDSIRVLTDAELQVLPLDEAKRLSARFGAGVERIIAKDVFEYHFATDADGESAWWLIFYGTARFLALAGAHRLPVTDPAGGG
jgi:hypothetical protein